MMAMCHSVDGKKAKGDYVEETEQDANDVQIVEFGQSHDNFRFASSGFLRKEKQTLGLSWSFSESGITYNSFDETGEDNSGGPKSVLWLDISINRKLVQNWNGANSD